MAKGIVCLVSNDLYTDQRMMRICSSLNKMGFEVTLVGRKLKHSKTLSPASYKQKRLKLFFTKGKLFYLELQIRYVIYLLSNKVDLVYAVDLDCIWPAAALKKLRGTPFIYDAHEFFTEVPELIGRNGSKKVWEYIAKTFIPKSSLNITVSPILAKALKQQYASDFKVISNMPQFRVAKQTKRLDLDLIYQGALNKGRGLEMLIDSLQFHAYQLHICGSGDIIHQLKRRVEEKGLENRVTFTGALSPDELWNYTQSAKLGFNLLENAGLNYYYSLANKFFDYAQAELPQICANFPAYQDFNSIHEVAILSDAKNAEELGSEIKLLLEDEEKLAQLKSNCKLAAAQWNWEKEEEKLENLMKPFE